jgi:predicted Zn-ribbon and HTH transcriptional regulator
MKTEEIPIETQPVIKDPRTTLCTCKRAMFVMQMPYVHCPSCHATYRSKRLTYPVRCGRCQFNLFAWRLRNCIPEITPEFQ